MGREPTETIGHVVDSRFLWIKIQRLLVMTTTVRYHSLVGTDFMKHAVRELPPTSTNSPLD